jgi:hypothetical protein
MSKRQEEFLRLFGEIALKFSNLEFLMRQLLVQLLDPNHHTVGYIMTDRMSLDQTLRRLRELVPYRLMKNKALTDEVMRVLGEVDKVRCRRNDFIHGQWELNEDCLAKGMVRCVLGGLKVTDVDGSVLWGALDLRDVPMKEFVTLSSNVGSLVMKTIHILEKHNRSQCSLSVRSKVGRAGSS